MLAYITGTVDQDLLVGNEYLAAENRILRAQIKGRLLLSDAEKATLAELAQRLGRKTPWKNWRRSRSPDTLLASVSKAHRRPVLTDRDFASESVAHEVLRKQNGLSLADGERKPELGLRSHCGGLERI